MAGKTETSRNNVLYVLLTLKNHSDRNNPLSIDEITEKLNKDFLPENPIHRTTVTRIMEGLMYDKVDFFRLERDIVETSSPEEIEDIHNLGFYLKCVVKKNGEFTDYDYRDDKKTAKFYYYECTLLESELMILYLAMETYPNFAIEDLQNISQKLSSLRPLFKKDLTYLPSEIDKFLKEDACVLQNIIELKNIIKNKNLVKIDYSYYDENLVMQRKYGYPKELLPLKLIWSNGFCYLVVKDREHSNTINLRVDRISDLEEIRATTKEIKEFNKAGSASDETDTSKSDYRAKHPVMYSGKLTKYDVLVKYSAPNMMNTMVDVFGRDIKIKEPPSDLIKRISAPHEKWILAEVRSSKGGMELFATEYCNDVIILSPEESATRVKETLQKALSHYK